MPEEVVKEIRRKKTALEEYKDRVVDPAKALVETLDKKELEKMIETPAPQEQIQEEFVVSIDSSPEAKVVVGDLSKQYGIPGTLILIFRDKKSGRMHPYLTKEAMGMLLERKGYSRLDIVKTGPRHDPDKLRFHFVAELTPIIPQKALDALAMLKDVDREAFLKEYRRLTEPIEDDGFSSPDSVRMRTMKNAYNLERLAKTRAFRHVASLYTGAGFGMMAKELEDEATELEAALPESRPPEKEA